MWPHGGADTLLTGVDGQQLSPWALERAMRTARSKVKDLPAGFRYNDLRHYLASLLIASGADVKVVQARMRHASAKTTLDTYGHLWPDSDESTRPAIDAVIKTWTGTVPEQDAPASAPSQVRSGTGPTRRSTARTRGGADGVGGERSRWCA